MPRSHGRWPGHHLLGQKPQASNPGMPPKPLLRPGLGPSQALVAWLTASPTTREPHGLPRSCLELHTSETSATTPLQGVLSCPAGCPDLPSHAGVQGGGRKCGKKPFSKQMTRVNTRGGPGCLREDPFASPRRGNGSARWPGDGRIHLTPNPRGPSQGLSALAAGAARPHRALTASTAYLGPRGQEPKEQNEVPQNSPETSLQ